MMVAAELTDRAGASSVPQLLVSVRNVEEARAAIAGGCDILDVKDPDRGSLGRATLTEIRNISQVATAAGRPCSAAMGEVSEWECLSEQHDVERAPLQFAKLGLSGLRDDPDWLSRWQKAIDSAEHVLSPLRWVAVIYADSIAARAPEPERILDAVLSGPKSLRNRIAGVLVDTFSKSSGNLLDALSVDELTRLSQQARESGRFFALAGRLSTRTVESIADVPADVVAIRSAACVGENRTGRVDREAVAAFRERLIKTTTPLCGTAN